MVFGYDILVDFGHGFKSLVILITTNSNVLIQGKAAMFICTLRPFYLGGIPDILSQYPIPLWHCGTNERGLIQYHTLNNFFGVWLMCCNEKDREYWFAKNAVLLFANHCRFITFFPLLYPSRNDSANSCVPKSAVLLQTDRQYFVF